ncbi:MAG: ScpA family protein [bacterium]|nr:ScpA family protein [bacterium]
MPVNSNPYTVKVATFEGPLDVLLSLIEGKKLEITQISLAEVTNQFIQYVETTPIPPGILAEFLSVAAHLLIIKTKALLPFLVLSEEEEEELVDLEARLKLLQRYREAGKHLQSQIRRKQFSFGREATSIFSITFYPPENITANILHVHMRRIADEFRAFYEKQQYAQATLEKVVSLEERIRDLMKIIEGALEKRFHEAVGSASSKMEIIVTFLAMLELIKQRLVAVEQQGLFGEITIRKTN